MVEVAKLKDLLERVENAAGADHGLNIDILVGLGQCVREKRGRDRVEWLYPTDGKYRWGTSPYGYDAAPNVVASIDACVALIEKTLPGAKWSLHSDPCALVSMDGEGIYSHAATPALALLFALLKSLIAQASSGTGEQP